MVRQILYIARIFPLHQSLRLSSIHQLKPRLFTHNAQLLLISSTQQRPQLPFLHPSTGVDHSLSLPRVSIQHQLSRLLSTENKDYLKTNIGQGLKWGAYIWVFSGLITICFLGFNTERLERNYPTPPEWTLISRHRLRAACGNANPAENLDGNVDYANQGARYRSLLGRLENPRLDGAGLRPLYEDDKFYVKEVGKTVYDMSSKSEAWREGYYACLMGAGHSAERLDGWLHDITRDIAFPPSMVIGPTNPRPKPVPPGAASAPKEENCIRVFEEAGTYYSRILETRTFSTRQRVEAALAYADWLDYKNDPSAAKEMYELGLQIAVTGLPSGAGDVVDIKSGVIYDTAEHVSSNILLATTAMGRHYAQGNNLSAALPIFLSVLRARRRLRPAPVSQEPSAAPPLDLKATIRSLLVTPPYPPIPPSGNEPQLRTPASICEEAGIMVHIGEIFFASSLAEPTSSNPPSSSFLSKAASFFSSSQPSRSAKSQESGFSWTRDAINLAETTLLSTPGSDDEARNQCAECLDAGMENWSKMVGRKLKEAHAARMTGTRGQNSESGNNNGDGKGVGPGQDQSGNWVWKGIGVGEGESLGGIRTEATGRLSTKQKPSITKVELLTNPSTKQAKDEEKEKEKEEEKWHQEAKLVQSETARLAKLLRQEGFGQELEKGQRRQGREWGLL